MVGDGVVHRIDALDLVCPVGLVRGVGVGPVSNLWGVDDHLVRQLNQGAVTRIADRSWCGRRGWEACWAGREHMHWGEVDITRHDDRSRTARPLVLDHPWSCRIDQSP